MKQFIFSDFKYNMVRVTILKDIPSFVGIDRKTYGPFKKGDVTIIPELHVKGLKKKGGCE